MLNPRTFLMPKLTAAFGARAGQVYDLGSIVVFASIYYLVALWSLGMSFMQTNASPLWPPSGIAFAVILLRGYRMWPGIWLGATLVNIVVFTGNHFFDFPTACLLSMVIGIGNTLEALLGVFLLECFVGSRNPLYRVQDISKFVAIVFIATLASATTGAAAVGFAKGLSWPIFKTMWYTWWFGDTLSILILTPFLLIVHKAPFKLWPVEKVLEAFLLGAIFIWVGTNIFGESPFLNVYHFPAIYLMLPLMVWAAYRYGHWGTVAASLTIIYLGLRGTAQGLGPFVTSDMNLSLLLLQSFTGILTVTGLILAAALHQRQQAEDQILKNSQRFQALVDNNQDMIALLDKDAMITYASPSVTRVLGHGIDEFVGHHILELVHPDDQPNIIQKLQNAFSAPGIIIQGQCRAHHKDGSWRWVEGTAQNLLHEPAVKAIVVNYRDITLQKEAEEILRRDKESLEELVDERSKELLSTQKELKQASHLADIGTLAATVAHELRNPLGVIQMAAYNLKRKQNLTDDKHLINIEKKVWEGNQIIDNLLTYSRIKIPSYEHIHLFPLLDECISTAQSRFQEGQIVMEKKYNTVTDDIDADPQQMKEVFTNIINNAYQACVEKAGKIHVTVDREGDLIDVAVKDNGVGIAAEDLDKIFIPFFTRKSKGTGLGLTICNELVSLHHGKIAIESQKGEGTLVRVMLPSRKDQP